MFDSQSFIRFLVVSASVAVAAMSGVPCRRSNGNGYGNGMYCVLPRFRSSSVEEAMMRDRLITSSSFQHGLTTLGFKLSDEVRELVCLGLEGAASSAFP